jgi:tetratricopeptide (TPR) repeat protein
VSALVGSRFSKHCLTVALAFVSVAAVCGCGSSAAKARAPSIAAVTTQAAAYGTEFMGTRPPLHRTDTRLGAVPRLRAKEQLDRAVDDLARAARASDFADLDGLVRLAAAQIERAGVEKSAAAGRDLADAAQNLGRALVIEEHFAPALNQLALLHLARAANAADRAAAERGAAKAERRCTSPERGGPAPLPRDRETLELAMGIGLRTVREHPTYAPIHNTLGLIELELDHVAAAMREFEEATFLDPSYLDAYSNLAVMHLFTRNFQAAERAYDRILDFSNRDYDAYLGRALARRGQVTESNFGSQVKSVEADLERCIELDPNRPEAYYNDAILTEQFKLRVTPKEKAKSVIDQARSLFDTFIVKAAGHPEYAREVRLAKRRRYDIGSARVVSDCSPGEE